MAEGMMAQQGQPGMADFIPDSSFSFMTPYMTNDMDRGTALCCGRICNRATMGARWGAHSPCNELPALSICRSVFEMGALAMRQPGVVGKWTDLPWFRNTASEYVWQNRCKIYWPELTSDSLASPYQVGASGSGSVGVDGVF
jgi:hypothetical protein